ncbi:amidohydrolase family protein [Poritiphilus flavus]|uniref:Amidohydrolase family protein n=1 Tax=Poritiphilus flavus TaxID=2697053 RepID=A0A6L9EGD8_9FLAO|nr:amidohydrolase family protein [Poritiphilus flavus]NAS13588.1 amidohydrolase family protein [Poritiphilus flavus]
MRKFSWCIFLLFGCSSTLPLVKNAKYAKENGNSLTIELVNGNWYNGKTFEKKTVWIKNGLINLTEVSEVDTLVDLSTKYVIPPFAEAHNHNLESEYKLEERIDSYLDNGVYYVKLLSSIKKRIAPLMHNYNKPDGIDVKMAHAPLTGSGGHPIALRKRYFQYGYFNGLFNSLEEIESHGYFIIDNRNDLENNWAQIVSFEPDFIKIMLLYSEEYEERKNDTTYFGKKGLKPEMVPAIVKKAHKSGLRVSAHVATAYDFRVAVRAGVDEIAHLPEIHNGKPISMEDIQIAKKKNITLVTTASLVKKNDEKKNYPELLENVRYNLELLKKADLKLAIGSDMYNDNSVQEFNFLNEMNIFSNQELLRMWTENATATIFPNRKVGKLYEGYEASFLVLNKNPIRDISNINQSIVLKVKQGVILK